MSKKLLFIVSILSFLSYSLIFANFDGLNVYPVKEKVKISPGEKGKITLRVDIPDKSYIYGNPKGPGVGRPTTIEIKHPRGFIFKEPAFEKPIKHKAKADPDFVWIYKKKTDISLPFITNDSLKSGEYKITIIITALLCTDRSCTLHDFKIDYPVVITGKDVIASSVDSEINTGNPGKDKTVQTFFDEGNSIYDLSLMKPRFISSIDISNIIQAVIYGILAGLLLNFMPCVLPVISLKVMDLINYSGQDKSMMKKMGMLFTLGILTSFAILAILVSFLGYNWGGLFQHSLFLIIMIGIVFALSLALFNVFTINIPSFAGKATKDISNKYVHSYAKGFLVTLLATPCSGPFLGGTLAWASTQTPVTIFIIFFSVGIGMSIPYLILTTNPRLIRFIPKPGPWMVTFENVMAFLLLATVAYLICILEQSLIIPTIWFLLFIAIAAWQYGKFGAIVMARRKRIISRIAAVIIVLSGYFLSYNYFYGHRLEFESIEENKKAFSLSLLHENRKQGRIAIVEFTADWCPNCKLVEKTSLYTRKVANVIISNNIELMVADMTRKNLDAKSMLTALGSRSIPFLAVFPAGKSFFRPICLRDIYSEDDVLKAIEIALESK